MEPITLHCFCCRRPYQRGRFKCCAAPTGMASHKWLDRWCRVVVNDKPCGKCPRCGCEHREAVRETGTEIGWSTVDDIAPTRERLEQIIKHVSPYREAGEEG